MVKSIYDTLKSKILYVISLVSLIYLSYLYIRNKNNKSKIIKLSKKIIELTNKNVELSESNKKIIDSVQDMIVEHTKIVEIEKEISLEIGKTDETEVNAIAKFNTLIEQRNKRINGFNNE